MAGLGSRFKASTTCNVHLLPAVKGNVCKHVVVVLRRGVYTYDAYGLTTAATEVTVAAKEEFYRVSEIILLLLLYERYFLLELLMELISI